jgi:hypothetical protein
MTEFPEFYSQREGELNMASKLSFSGKQTSELPDINA